MNNHTQIKENHKSASGAAQSDAGKRARIKKRSRDKGELRGGSREIRISRLCLDELDVLAVRIKAGSLKIAKAAIRNYLDFIERYPMLAKTERIFTDCDASLGFFDPRQPVLVWLDQLCEIHRLSPSQTISSAIGVYLEYARLQMKDGQFARLIENNPGEIDPEQIAHLVTLPTMPARELFKKTVKGLRNMSLANAIDEARGLLGLIAPNPGFEDERVALEMMVEGADRLS